MSEIILEKTTNRGYAILFITGFIQVLLVCINTYQIAHGHLAGVIFVGFAISFVWSFNVKKIAFGGWLDRIVYSTGAAAGTFAGLTGSMWFYGGI